MARKALINKAKLKPKFSSRKINRCSVTGRKRGYLRYFGMSRIMVLELARKGELPGFFKSSN
jgi:small subunit ribosomal protein S14